MFHHMKWDDQLLFICSILRSCKELVHIDGRQVLYSMTADHKEEISFAIICTIPIGGHYL